jgi:hypothetical protein
LVALDRFSEAATVFDILMPELKKPGHTLLFGNALEIQAQIFLGQKDFSSARNALQQAHEHLSGAAGSHPFFVKKWSLIADWKEGQTSPAELRQRTEALQAEARGNANWGSVRHLDLVMGIETRDLQLLRHVYFGSPIPSYRSQIENAVGRESIVKEGYDWHLHAGDQPYLIDVATAKFNGQESGIGSGHLVHQFLTVLCRDFYTPIRSTELFCELHPDMHYNPTTSGATVAQLLTRLRRILEALDAPLKIIAKDSSYSMEANAPLAFRFTAMPESSRVDQYSIRYLNFKKKYVEIHQSENIFSTPELVSSLGVSKMTVLRFLKDGEARGWIKREGNGVKTRYRWAA